MRVDAIYGAIGRFSVRFRWLVVLIWIAGTIAAATQLPALSSVTQGNNQKFLPASAPSAQAAELAAPFGTGNSQPIPVVAATTSGSLTPADITALAHLQAQLATVPGINRVINAGRSADGAAEQLVVLAKFTGSGNPNYAKNLVDGLRAQIARADLPAGLSAHVTGDLAEQVDQQKASGSTSNRVQVLSVLFVILLLVCIFRSITLAITTVLPAGLSVAIAGPLVAEAARHGLQVSPIAQLLLIVLVIGAGTDYGLFLVFRVREELRARDHDTGGELHPGTAGTARSMLADVARPRPAAAAAIIEAVTRVGESISASAATVIAAVLTLLLASFSFYSDLAWPFAIAVGVILLAGLTLLPALLSVRLSLLAIKRSLLQAMTGRPKLLPWSIQGRGGPGVWGRVAGRIVQHPVPTLLAGVVFFGGLSFAVLGYASGGFGGTTTPPAGSDSAAGASLLAKHFPQSAADKPDLPVPPAGLGRRGAAGEGDGRAAGNGALYSGRGRAEPGRRGYADGGAVPGPVRRARRARKAARYADGGRPAGRPHPGECLPALPGDRELRQP
jgi:putative drug exporter of the RND superfamily